MGARSPEARFGRRGRPRVPQLTDDVKLELRLPPTTEEWADEMLVEACDGEWEVERTDQALFVRKTVGGNCNALSNAQTFLGDVEEALRPGEVEPMVFTLIAIAVPPAGEGA